MRAVAALTRAALTCVVLGVWGTAAAAQDCDSPLTQSDMNACAQADWQAEDARLNAVWAEALALMRSIDEDLPKHERGAADGLRRGQRAWLTFRDETCAAQGYLAHGGGMEPLLAQKDADAPELAAVMAAGEVFA